MPLFIIAIATATLAATAAFGNDPPRKPSGKDPMARRVCIVEPAMTGSRIPKKECKSRGAWIAETGVDPVKKK